MKAVAAALLLALALFGLAAALPTGALMDFGSFLASGDAAARGLDPYGIYPLTLHLVLPGFESWNPNLNPPASLPLFAALARLEPQEAFRLWWAVSALCYAGAVVVLARRHGRPLAALWALAAAGLWDTLVLGQIYLPLVLAAVLAWEALERGRAGAAGLLVGLVVGIKPNFLVWPALLLLAGHRRPAGVALVTAAVLQLPALVLYSPGVFVRWLTLVADERGRAGFLTNTSLAGLASRLGWPAAGVAAGGALLLVLAAWAWRRRPPVLAVSVAGLLGAVLASPIAWVHYTLFLLPLLFVLPPSPPLLLAAALLAVPVPWVLGLLTAPGWQQATAGSIYGWAVLLLLVAAMRAEAARGRKEVTLR